VNTTINKKCPAANEQFGASGGAISSDTEQVTYLLLSSEPFLTPRLPPSCHHVSRHPCGQRGANRMGTATLNYIFLTINLEVAPDTKQGLKDGTVQ